MTRLMPKLGFRFEHSYQSLSPHGFVACAPTKVSAPSLVMFNHELAKALGLEVAGATDEELAAFFSGNSLPEGAAPMAQAYCGHQFGHFATLGDGRALILGEHLTPQGQRVDLALKGSGPTPFSRRGDGRAALKPMLREYLISEAMHGLGIPTTRSLCVVATCEPVFRQKIDKGAVLTRIAASHIRVGTFEFFAANNDKDGLKKLADHTIARHYPEILGANDPYGELLQAVCERQIALIIDWMRVGFIHGVMNTDNMSLSGETIDYGPCAFMDSYDPSTVFSAIDRNGRYSYGNQPKIALWNLTRLAETLLPLLDEETEAAIDKAEAILEPMSEKISVAWLLMMRQKLGLFSTEPQDEALIPELLRLMQTHEADYTATFRALISENLPDGTFFHSLEVQNWWQDYQARLAKNTKPLASSFCLMRANNPVLIPRNHRVEEALDAADEGDLAPFLRLLSALKNPYEESDDWASFKAPPATPDPTYQTFCGT